jgi:transcriptional regulator with XRE-family HTH domain
MGRRRKAEEIEELLERYRASGMTQEEYCRQAGVGRSTLDRYLRRQRNGQRLVRVSLDAMPEAEQDGGFVLVLGNGRRIESGWKFGEAALARLIRVAEGVQ